MSEDAKLTVKQDYYLELLQGIGKQISRINHIGSSGPVEALKQAEVKASLKHAHKLVHELMEEAE